MLYCDYISLVECEIAVSIWSSVHLKVCAAFAIRLRFFFFHLLCSRVLIIVICFSRCNFTGQIKVAQITRRQVAVV